jgi:hypothetical protein
LYFVQALNPYLEKKNDIDDQISNYYYGPLSKNDTSSIISITAAYIFIIESAIYIVALYIARTYGDPNIVIGPLCLDWNMWGNLFFFLGSLGYLYTAYTAYFHIETRETEYLNIFLASLFVLDSMCYLFAVIWSENSKVRLRPEMKVSFDSNIDWYFLATLFYILGSVAYQVQAIQAFLKQESSLSNLVAATVFMIDAPLYVVSSFHKRVDDDEIDLTQRENLFIIEKSKKSIAIALVKNKTAIGKCASFESEESSLLRKQTIID